ncbi:MAG: hypothetical protein MRZ79_12220 [Bacteroidia bacterium]|nr:hypothetical protein [Bacteroidia bacterium]
MPLLLRLISLLILCTSIHHMHGQTFPESWQGKWTGTLNIWGNNQIVDSFPMSLEISPTDSNWNYIITYQKDSLNPDRRPYSILSVNDSLGHYAIDEHNNILLDTYLNGNCLYTHFGGMGFNLASTICMEDEFLEYEITQAPTPPYRTSGDTIIVTDTIPPIQSFEVMMVLRAKLQRE